MDGNPSQRPLDVENRATATLEFPSTRGYALPLELNSMTTSLVVESSYLAKFGVWLPWQSKSDRNYGVCHSHVPHPFNRDVSVNYINSLVCFCEAFALCQSWMYSTMTFHKLPDFLVRAHHRFAGQGMFTRTILICCYV